MHHHSTKCQKVVQIHKLLFLTYAKGKKEVRRAGGESPQTLRPNFNCEKGSVTAGKPPVRPAGGVLLVKIHKAKKAPLKGELASRRLD